MATKGPVVIVTGSNQGLGYHVVEQLAASQIPYTIYLTSRSLSSAQAAKKSIDDSTPTSKATIIPLELDLASPSSIAAAVSTIKSAHSHIDILVNNAGISSESASLPSDIAKVLTINVTGTAALTEDLLPLLLASKSPAGARLIFVTTGLGSLTWASDETNMYYAIDALPYRISKAAENMLMLQYHKTLAREAKKKGVAPIKVWGVCPGFCQTNLGGTSAGKKESGARDPALGGKAIVNVMEGKRDDENGLVVGDMGEIRPW